MYAGKALAACFLLGFAVCVNTSCRKENMINPALADTAAVFSATVGGVNWQTDSVSAFLVKQSPFGSKIMTITGYTSNRVITVSLKDTSRTGTNDSTMAVKEYMVLPWMSTAEFSYVNNWIAIGRAYAWQQQGAAETGEATVTASNGASKTISGTFSFTAQVLSIDSTGINVDSVQVTNGVFQNIPYTFFGH